MQPSTLEEFERLITRIERHQADIDLNDKRFAIRYASYIGSEKTWAERLRRNRGRDFGETAEKWLRKLRVFVETLDGVRGVMEIHETYPIVQHAAYLYDKLKTQKNDRRCAWLIGVQGVGKSIALSHLLRKNPADCVFISANETWKESRMCIARALAEKIGSQISASASDTLEKAMIELKINPRTLLLDEWHEAGVLGMKLVKSIINDTPSRVIVGQYPTAWRRLNNGANDAYAEAQQLLRRSLRPVKKDWMGGLNEDDVRAFLAAHKIKGFDGMIEEYLPLIQQHGNYSLLADAMDRAEFLADSSDQNVTAPLFKAQLRAICGLPAEKKEAA